MTIERDKPSGSKPSVARTTARDVPFTRDAGSDAEPAPRGQRPQQLPRDPTYEAELAQVELAVLRNPERRDDPSTKQGGRRGHAFKSGEPPESVTPESPGAAVSRSPEPPSSSGRSVASGTLLSVGAVDPRGKTERTLETPRMYFSRVDAGGEAYFKPGKIPAVTVHQTLETETVKLADSIDPRRAKTLPRIDRTALARFASDENEPESPAPMMLEGPRSSLDIGADAQSPRWNQEEYEPASSLGEHDGQIHASLSPFRDRAEPSFDHGGVPTRVEPLAARRTSDVPEAFAAPDTSATPTQRDLPAHRIEDSLPAPPPVPSRPLGPISAELGDEGPASEGPSATTASIAAEEPERRPAWVNFAAFAIALLVTVAFGMWLTRAPEPRQSRPDGIALPAQTTVTRTEPLPLDSPPNPVAAPALSPPGDAEEATARTATSPPRSPAAGSVRAPLSTRKPAPIKSSPRETIF